MSLMPVLLSVIMAKSDRQETCWCHMESQKDVRTRCAKLSRLSLVCFFRDSNYLEWIYCFLYIGLWTSYSRTCAGAMTTSLENMPLPKIYLISFVLPCLCLRHSISSFLRRCCMNVSLQVPVGSDETASSLSTVTSCMLRPFERKLKTKHIRDM